MNDDVTLRFSVRGLLFAVAIIAASLAVFRFIRAINYQLDDEYAQWGAAEMVLDYLEDHRGEWPADWTSLEDYYDRNRRVSGWTFEEFKERVELDFNPDVDAIREHAGRSPNWKYRVIWPRYSFAELRGWVGFPINQAIHDYFRSMDETEN